MPYRILTLCVCVVLLATSSIHAEDHNQLVVTWLEGNNVMVWHNGDNAPTGHEVPENVASNVRQLLLSSDGQYVALNAAYPGSLWLATPTDSNLIELVPNQALLTTDDPKNTRIGNLQRGENATFFFNTSNQPSHYSFQNNDLWSVDAVSRTFQLLLPPSEGGLFDLSPDRQHIAIIQSGTYNQTEGKISLVDHSGQSRQDILNFPAVSTASDYDFYPQVFWQPDSTAFNVAIPDKDLIYHDDTALTALWHIGTDGTKTQQGSLQGTFFGLPVWSDDGKYLAYLRRKGDITTNQFELVTDDGDGKNPIVYTSGAAGYFGTPEWLPNSDQFIYPQGTPGEWWIGQPDQAPLQLPENFFSPHFVDATTYVFGTINGELRYARLGSTDSILIAKITGGVPMFDALLLP